MILYAVLSMIPFTALTLLNSNDIGLFSSSFIIIYFVLRLALNPKMKTEIDFLSLILLLVFIYFVATHILAIL